MQTKDMDDSFTMIDVYLVILMYIDDDLEYY